MSIHTLAAADGTLVLDGPWQAGEVQSVMLTDGTIRAGVLPLGGEVSVAGTSTLEAQDLQFAASSVTNLAGNLTLRGNASIQAGAQFTGASPVTVAESSRLTIADGGQSGVVLVNQGALALGHEGPGVASVELAALRQDAAGVLEIDLARPDQFDRLVSVQSPHLGGTLRVSLLNNFEPDPDDRFTIIESASSIVGKFEALDLPQLREGLDWSLEYLPDRVTLLTIGMPPMLRGDYDASGRVDQRDLDLVLLHWGHPADQVPPEWTSDPPNGLVDQDELDPVLLGWGSVADGQAADAVGVPEPSSLGSACIILLLALKSHHQSRAKKRQIKQVQITTMEPGSGTPTAP
jgi:hypothetical protein